MADAPKTQSVLTPRFRASYVNVFKARKGNKPSDKPKFSIAACYEDDAEVPKGSVTIAALKQMALEAAYAKWGDTEDTRKKIKSGKIKMPFITGERLQDDIDDKKVPEGTVLVMRFSTGEEYKPGVVDRFRGPDGKAVTITSDEVFYSGCYARAEVRVWAYDSPESKGVTFMLNNVQKLGDGERLGGGKRSAGDVFEAFDDAPPATPGMATAEAGDDDNDAMGLGI